MPLGWISWLGNNQIVFSGTPVNSQGPPALYIWSTAGIPKVLLNNSPGGCTSNNTVYATQFTESSEEQRYRMEAPKFKPEPQRNQPSPAKSKFEPISCSTISTPATLAGRTWKPLKKGHGFLDFGPKEGPPQVERLAHISENLIDHSDTGIRTKRPAIPKTAYAPFNNSYLIYDLNVNDEEFSLWQSTGERRIWRLNPQWHGSPVNIPYGDWATKDVSFLPTRPGLLIISNNFAPNYSAGGAGLYLLTTNTAAQRLERGLAQDVAVSPNGCRIAYGFRPRLDTGLPEGGPRLVVLDLCSQATTATTTP